MNNYYPKFSRKDNYQRRYYNNRGNYNQRRNNHFQNNNNYYFPYYNNYIRKYNENICEKEIPYDKEMNDNSFSKSTNSNSRKNSFCESCESNEINKNDEINNNNNNITNQQNNNIIQKLNLSKNVLNSAFFVPKSYKEKKNIIKKQDIECNNDNKNNKKEENTVILAINIKLSKEKIFFELRKYDDMFSLIQKVCQENEIEEKIREFLPKIIMKALNAIYGVMNLKLKKEEIELLNVLKEKCL